MIRSSQHSLKQANPSKRQQVKQLVREYRRLAQEILDDLWLGSTKFDPMTRRLQLPKYPDAGYLKRFGSRLTARMLQCCGVQVLGMLRAATRKRSKQYYVLARLQREGKDHQRLQRFIDLHPLTKPNCNRIQPTLDSRFVDFSETPDGAFDLFLRISSIGQRQQIKIPLQHHRASRKWLRRGQLKRTIRLSNDTVYLMYEVPDVPKRQAGTVVGCDQGYLTAVTLSDGQATTACPHGHDLRSIAAKMSRCKPGSKGFRRAQQHRRNFTNWALNRLDWSDVGEVRLERVKRLRYKKKQHNQNLIHWCYPLIKRKLTMLSETEGFVLEEVSNAFRSQRCSSCGWVRRANRKGKTFCCDVCGYAADADQNAASNLKLDLFEIPPWVRQRRINRLGFYWQPDGLFNVGHEPIVRGAKETTRKILLSGK